MIEYHVPVLLNECIKGLNINPEGIIVDVTYGGGGHSKEILKQLTSGKLIAFDQDSDAHKNAINDNHFTLVESNFEHLKNQLRFAGAIPVDGILADLGVSSHQFDEASRGFSFRFDEAELDMRMDQQQSLSAKQIINTYTEAQLADLFFFYGELKNARKIAKAIIVKRAVKPIDTVGELKSCLLPFAPKFKDYKFFAQVFQALRIEVNNEMGALKALLEQSADVIKKGGRLVVISYHSLEDKLVKNYMNKGKFEGDTEKDFYGNEIKPFHPLNRKAIVPDAEEMTKNPRSRSAKLRIAEKI
ncbi:MAG: 16S rRNA (cytosine(1402)-N(4))-methyltransferase RsmH [Bacteroidia bacterium]|nr:16S rRNA (cytosine(1402)-N(4))-methyltransferase RsmH [Bacteroidia bacterium]